MLELVGSLLSLMFMAIMLLCVIVAVLWLSYNTLQTHSQDVRKSHSAIAAAVKSKTDLVRQLFEIAKEYGAHEQFVHSFVATAEGQPAGGPAVPVGNVAGVFSQMARAYPDLKANENYAMLMKQLERVETNILHRRDQYNETANRYNTRRNSLPTVLIAGRLGFNEAPYFSGDDGDMLELFQSDSGENLRATLVSFSRTVGDTSKRLGTDFSRTVGDTSKRLGADIGQRGRQLAEYGRTRLDRTQDRADRPDDPDDPDDQDIPTPTNH